MSMTDAVLKAFEEFKSSADCDKALMVKGCKELLTEDTYDTSVVAANVGVHCAKTGTDPNSYAVRSYATFTVADRSSCIDIVFDIPEYQNTRVSKASVLERIQASRDTVQSLQDALDLIKETLDATEALTHKAYG